MTDVFEKIPDLDVRSLHGLVVTLEVLEESGYLILAARDHKNKTLYVLSLDKDEG